MPSRSSVRAARPNRRHDLEVEPLEDRTLLASSLLRLDFGTVTSPIASGYTRVEPKLYSPAAGFGWKSLSGITAYDSGAANPLTRDLHRGRTATFQADMVNGAYDVTFTLGDPAKMIDRIELRDGTELLATNLKVTRGNVLTLSFEITVTTGQLNLQLLDRGGTTRGWGLRALEIVPTKAPVVNAGADRTTQEGKSTAFSGTASGDGPLTYFWEFGDGATASGTLTPTHTYADDGVYAVTLTVTDALGRSTEDELLVTATNVAPSPNANGPYSGTVGTNITFAGTATDPSSADTSAGFTWLWIFGDGGTSNLKTATHSFASPGTYAVALTVADKDGGTATTNTTAVVTADDSGGDWIVTPHDKVPNFGKNPTIVSVASGNWSDVRTWSAGRLPQAGDIVAIRASNVVTYDVNSAVKLNTLVVRAGGELMFRTDVSTRLVVGNLLVLEDGALAVGTESKPIGANVLAEIVIANQPLNTARDPEQWGTGLIGLGKVTMHGAARSASFVRLAAEPRVGQKTLALEQAVTGWRPGDRLYLPDSRQLRDFERGSNYVPRWEELTIESISVDGKTITLTQALKFDHPGARNGAGVLEFLPHVANLTRNILIRSEIPTGTRAHVAFLHEAEVDVRYAQFRDLGRTTNAPLDSTTFNPDGTVKHIGTNQIGRYPIHIHHVVGPHDIPANGFQFTLIGNSVDGGSTSHNLKWGVALHDSHYGLIRNNVVYNFAGAGLVTEDGSESYNVIERNFVARISGTGTRLDLGREGLGFWFRGTNNYVRDNVVANIGAANAPGAASYGFNYFLYFIGEVTIPTVQGDHDSGVDVDMNTLPVLEFTGNEVYGATPSGLTYWHIGTLGDWPNDKVKGDSIFKDLRVWHHHEYGIFGYPSDRIVFDGLNIRGDPAVVSNPYEYVTGLFFSDYPTRNLTIKNSNIQGMQTGIMTPFVAPGTTTIRDTYLRNISDIVVSTMWSVNGSKDLPVKKTVIQNVRFDGLAGRPHTAIDMNYDTSHGNNLIQKDDVFVYDFNGQAGKNYRVYYKEQRADFIVPMSSGPLIGSPEAGLTNAQNWTKYGIAIAGAVAPGSATTVDGIDGLVVPI